MECDYEDGAGDCHSPHGCYCAKIADAVVRDEKSAAEIILLRERVAELERVGHDAANVMENLIPPAQLNRHLRQPYEHPVSVLDRLRAALRAKGGSDGR